MSRSLFTLLVVGILGVAWQLTGQDAPNTITAEEEPAANITTPKHAPTGGKVGQKSPGVAHAEIRRKAEQKIFAAMNTPINVKFIETPLHEAIDFFGNTLNVPVYIDDIAVADEGIATDEPVNFMGEGLAARTALELILSRLQLTWVVRHELLYITSTTASEDFLTTVVYDVTDLVELVEKGSQHHQPLPGGGFGGGGSGGLDGAGGSPMSGGGFGAKPGAAPNHKPAPESDEPPLPDGPEPTRPRSGGSTLFSPVTSPSQFGGQFGGGEKIPANMPTSTKDNENPEMIPNFDQLIEMLQNETTGPWEEIEGIGGTLSQFEHIESGKRILVIRQSQTNHFEIQEILHEMRQIIHAKQK